MSARQYPGMVSIPCSIMRGGSSKGAFFLEDDLPLQESARHAVLLAAYGSPDPRQIDGLGGADPLTSKAASVRKSSRPDADLDYTFYQVGVDTARVTMGGTCGNMLAAVVPFALNRNLVQAPEGNGEVAVRVHAVNTGQVFTLRVETSGGLHRAEGDCIIAGVPGQASRILVDFGDCAGSMSGRLLPTGNAMDVLDIDGSPVRVSLVDAATPFVFVRAEDVGAKGTETPEELLAAADVMARLERVRGWAAKVLGLVQDESEARAKTPNVPRVVLTSAPASYVTVRGERVEARDIDVCVRQLAMQKPHKALAVTGSICTAVAAALPGTTVHQTARKTAGEIRLGHPSGSTSARCRLEATESGNWKIARAEIERTARLLMDGCVFVRNCDIAHHEATP